jgi:initiation factor 1A
MPRSNTTGGSKHKKYKKNKGVPITNKVILTAKDGQVYGSVVKRIGGTRIIINCSDQKERSGIIPGKFFKKIWMNEGDIVLCDLNMGSDDQCYIVHKYSNHDANVLKNQGKIDFEICDDMENIVIGEIEEENNIFENNVLLVGNQNRVRKMVIDFSESGNEDESEEGGKCLESSEEVEVDLNRL